MKTNRLFSLIVCFLCLGMLAPAMTYANTGDNDKKDKKEKKKKEKKPYVWTMPKLTGDKAFDDYLKLCDELNTKIKKYSEDITFYEVAEIHVVGDNGEEDVQYFVVDSVGNLRSSNAALAQNLDIIFAYPNLVLDATNMTAATASATTAIAGNPMLALSHGKYLKAGPILSGRAFKEMKVIYKKARNQAKQIKALKAGKIDELKALNAEMNAGDIDAGTASLTKYTKSKAEVEAQFAAIQPDEEKYKSDASREEPDETI